MSPTVRGGSMSDLFMPSYVPHTRPDGRQILRYVLRCRWCFVPVSHRDDPLAVLHDAGCPVGALVARWTQEGHGAGIVDEYDAILDDLEAINRTTSDREIPQ